MSLRTFHLIFILFAIIGADLFGLWSISNYRETGDALILGMGIASFVGGFGLIVYVWQFVRRLDAANIH